ncbi:MAG: NACHT domain-containing protein [Deltaproteobacteria bacterium]|nr:NACHT domain-containing protein [Deltaproteobacteria bacterium]
MNDAKKLKMIRDISDEKSLRSILCNLFRRMGFKHVAETHGPNEHGKDIVFYGHNEYLDTQDWHAVVVKHGKITGAASAPNKGTISIVATQINLCFSVPLKIPKGVDVYCGRVWVVCNDDITNNGRSQIKSEIRQIGSVEFVNANMLLSLLDKYWPEFFSTDPDFFSYMSGLLKDIDFYEEQSIIKYPTRISKTLDLFIAPRLYELAAQPSESDEVRPPIKKIKMSLDKIRDNLDYYAIFGDPGSGKTTLMRRIVRDVIEHNRTDEEGQVLPLTVRLKNYRGNLDENINACLKRYNADLSLDNLQKEKSVLILMDGFDEISNKELRETFIVQLEKLRAQNANRYFILFSRPVSDVDVQLRGKGIKILELAPMENREVLQFVEKWVQNTSLSKTKLLEAISDSGILAKLPKTPMVLTLIAIIVESGKYQELPANLADLYEMFFDVLLGMWDKDRGLEVLFEYQAKLQALRQLAMHMHSEALEKIDEAKSLEIVNKYFDSRGIDLDCTSLLKEIIERTNLVFIDDRRQLRFKHLSFQEYLTAQEIAKGDVGLNFFSDYVTDVWWENVVFFYVGIKKDVPGILKEIFENTKLDDYRSRGRFLMGIGPILQAAYFTDKHERAKLLVKALSIIPTILDDVHGLMKENNANIFKKFSRFWLLWWMRYIVEYFYGSSTISVPAEIAMKEILNDQSRHPIDKWVMMYMLASAMNKIGNSSYLLKLSESVPSGDVEFSQLIKMQLDEMTSDNLQLRKAKAKIGKRLKSFGREVIKELKKPAYRLADWRTTNKDEVS